MTQAFLRQAFEPYSPLDLPSDIGRGPIPLRNPPLRPKRHRTLFISDVHLGTLGCKAEALAEFLTQNSCETLFLAGHIVDGWRLRRRWYWPETHSRVIDQILHKVDTGTRVIYMPGNHDEAFRDYCGRAVAGVAVLPESIHETAGGKRLLVVHGDQFDGVIAGAKWPAHLGDWAYTLALQLNEILGAIRRRLGLPCWSLSAYLKQKVKNAVEYICRFQDAVARERGFDGSRVRPYSSRCDRADRRCPLPQRRRLG